MPLSLTELTKSATEAERADFEAAFGPHLHLLRAGHTYVASTVQWAYHGWLLAKRHAAYERNLEREIAYAAARSDIELYCNEEDAPLDGRRVYLLDTALQMQEIVDKSVRYLELRGLLVRMPADIAPNRAVILDDDPPAPNPMEQGQ